MAAQSILKRPLAKGGKSSQAQASWTSAPQGGAEARSGREARSGAAARRPKAFLDTPAARAAEKLISPPQSAFQRYIRLISRFPVLSKEEEYQIAVEYYETKNPQAAEKLIHSNLRFVVKVAWEYGKFGAKIMDLIQEGNLGLLKAVKEFNPYREARLITYAVWWIRGCIQEHLLRSRSVVRIGASKREKALYYMLQREQRALGALTEVKRLPALSQKTGLPIREIEALRQRVQDVSLDQPVRQERGSKSLLDFQEDRAAADFEEQLSDQRLSLELRKALKKIKLSSREQRILNDRLLKSPPETLQEIAKAFKISREAVRQSEERLLKKLGAVLKPILKKPY